ncbi:MAG: NAD(P)/FAD-dependent oxidoreductase [Firmicutes bacterium]|jgi:sarcosine oxidase subunit alpha|nr:NAD(P)/FAD-dependent oxidoreductase [Bacillota bacterium]
MRETEIAVVGAGPAGLCAALAAASCGAAVTLIDREERPGGQLVKQTHKFFGSERQDAGTRGIDIGRRLSERAMSHPGIRTMLECTALGYYADGVLCLEQNERFIKLKVKRMIVATGASERMLAFPNNDLPGIYGAGAVQTLMNVHGVRPGDRVLMVGAGNIGLIVSYQLAQAGVKVAAVVEALPKIGGYAVHASKIRRLGIPILTSHSVKEAHGKEVLEGVTVWRLDPGWRGIPGTEMRFDVDVMCLAVGLSPLTELLWQAGCEMKYVAELGGHVATRDDNLETTVKGIFVAGDASGVEEASSAMVGGRLAGYAAAASLGYCPDFETKKKQALWELAELRAGPTGEKIRKGLAALRGEAC